MATATVAYEEPRKHKLVPGSRVLIEPGLHPAGSGATGHPQLGYVVRVKGDRALVDDADGENWYPLSRLTEPGAVTYCQNYTGHDSDCDCGSTGLARINGKVVDLRGKGPPYPPAPAAESGLSDYIAQTKLELARLGSPDPTADIKAQHETLARLRKAGLPPNVAASTIYSLERGFSPEMLRAGEKPSEAREYVAVDHAGKYVFGPTRDFQEAKFHADRAHGYVKWGDEAAECLGLHTHGAPPAGTVVVAAAGEGASEAPTYNKQAYLPPGYEQWEHGFAYFPEWKPKRHHQSYAGREWDEDWQVARGSSKWTWGVKQNDATSWSVFAIDRHGHQYHVAFAGSEADAKHAAAVADTQSAPRGSAAAEGPHSQPSTTPAASCCTKESSIEIARQIPGGPWAYVRSYPREAPARIERQQDYVIGGKTVTASFCGKYLLLRCPTNGTQYLFEGACIVDPAKPAPPAVVAVKGKPFTVRIKQGKTLVAELGPFAKITDAKAALDKTGKPGQVAGIYEDGKVADYRGDRAIFGFGRTRWSRA